MAGNVEQWPDGSRHVWDGPTATYTETDQAGTVVLTRPFTDEEAAAYPRVDPQDAPDPIVALQAQVDALTDIVLGGAA